MPRQDPLSKRYAWLMEDSQRTRWTDKQSEKSADAHRFLYGAYVLADILSEAPGTVDVWKQAHYETFDGKRPRAHFSGEALQTGFEELIKGGYIVPTGRVVDGKPEYTRSDRPLPFRVQGAWVLTDAKHGAVPVPPKPAKPATSPAKSSIRDVHDLDLRRSPALQERLSTLDNQVRSAGRKDYSHTPVYELDALIRTASWLRALARTALRGEWADFADELLARASKPRSLRWLAEPERKALEAALPLYVRALGAELGDRLALAEKVIELLDRHRDRPTAETIYRRATVLRDEARAQLRYLEEGRRLPPMVTSPHPEYVLTPALTATGAPEYSVRPVDDPDGWKVLGDVYVDGGPGWRYHDRRRNVSSEGFWPDPATAALHLLREGHHPQWWHQHEKLLQELHEASFRYPPPEVLPAIARHLPEAEVLGALPWLEAPKDPASQRLRQAWAIALSASLAPSASPAVRYILTPAAERPSELPYAFAEYNEVTLAADRAGFQVSPSLLRFAESKLSRDNNPAEPAASYISRLQRLFQLTKGTRRVRPARGRRSM